MTPEPPSTSPRDREGWERMRRAFTAPTGRATVPQRPGHTEGLWTPQEEANLQKLMGEMGTGRNWPAVAERQGRVGLAGRGRSLADTGRRARRARPYNILPPEISSAYTHPLNPENAWLEGRASSAPFCAVLCINGQS